MDKNISTPSQATFFSLRMRYTLNQHKQYREVITTFLNRNALIPVRQMQYLPHSPVATST